MGLFVMNADGSDVTFLNRIGGASLDAPTWSPDSRRIAFEVCSDESRPRWDCDIYVANADGSGLTNLTNHPANDFAPAWEPTP
jgi:TolB protein